MEPFIFKPRARLLLQLGDQLIKNESVALLELLRNAYDADAKTATVTMSKIDKPNEGSIVIEDDGIGMDLNIIENVWMEPGSNYKEELLLRKQRTERFDRLPIGEKGIGRFGAHKLGYKIELVSRKKDKKEVFLKIDWDSFGKPRYLKDVPINIDERDPIVFTQEKTGTKIIITNLRTPWTRGMVRNVYRSMKSLCSPFEGNESFDVIFNIDEKQKEWLNGILSREEVKERALFKVNCELEGQKIVKFQYNFTPYNTMKKLSPRIVTESDLEMTKVTKLIKVENKKQISLDLSKYRIGTVKLELYIFDRDAKILNFGIQDKKGFTNYLDENGGVRVYRSGVRVFDYGEEGNDWLGLDTRRVNVPTKRLSNNLILGAVHIDRLGSEDLEEKTNREGFIENEAYHELVDSILWTLSQVETLRQVDKQRIRTYYVGGAKAEPVVETIDNIRKTVEKKIKDTAVKKELIAELDHVETEYKNITNTLLRSAGAGLNLSVVIHEIEKIVAELEKVVKKEPVSNRILNLTKRLSEMIDGYSDIIRGTGIKKENLIKILDQALFNIEFRLESHQINVDKFYKNAEEYTVNCAKNLILGSILNIIDNSIWWLEYSEVKNKRIYINLETGENGICVIIADNGPGFTLPTDIIDKPFISGKPDGMGLGLHIASEIMRAQGGYILYPDWGEYSIPDEYKNGAIVVLCFKREDNKC